MKLALFDLDHTLLPIDSDFEWGEFTVKLGWVDAIKFRDRNGQFFADYQAGTLNGDEYLRFAAQAFCAKGRAESLAAQQRFMAEVIEPNIHPKALALVERHRAAGDTLALVTATNEFVTGPIAARLGFDTLIATQLKRSADGWYLPQGEGTPCFQAGKVTRVIQWLDAQGVAWADIEHSVFYSDSANDLPLLEMVHEPVATNPSDSLRSHAQAQGWRILDLFA